MERYIIWYLLSLKNYWKKRSSYLTILGMIFLVWVISGISAPDAANMKVGLCCGSSVAAGQIKDTLIAEESDFEFIIYEEEESLIQDVIRGSLDSGFVFSEEFDRLFEKRDTSDGITYYKTPFSTKDEVLKEKIFAAYFKLYSRNVLEDAQKTVFGDRKADRLEELLEKNERYLSGDGVFQLKVEPVEGFKAESNQKESNGAERGLILLSIFFVMFFAYIETQLGEGDKTVLALSRREQFVYRFIKMQAAGILPALIGILLILQICADADLFHEIFRLSIFLILSGLWINVVGKRLGKIEHLPAWLMSIAVLHILLCPIFYDFSIYIPAVKCIRNLLPLGIYYIL